MSQMPPLSQAELTVTWSSKLSPASFLNLTLISLTRRFPEYTFSHLYTFCVRVHGDRLRERCPHSEITSVFGY